MSENSESNAVLGFVAGAIIVAAIVFFFFVGIPGGGPDGSTDLDVNIETPAPAAPAAPAN